MGKVVLRVLSISATILFCLLAICGIYQVGLRCYNFGYRVYTEPPVSQGDGDEALVQIRQGMDQKELAELLEEKGLIRDSKLFFVQEKLYGFELQPGKYRVSAAMDARELMAAMTPAEEEESEEEDG